MDITTTSKGHQPSGCIACPSCDLLFDVDELEDGEIASCSRCGHFLTKYRADEFERVLAFAFSALTLLILACSYPFMSFKAGGLESMMTLPQTASNLWKYGMPFLSFLVAAFIIFVPALIICLILFLVIALVSGRSNQWLGPVARLIYTLLTLSMAEVFFIGVLVSLVKLGYMATVMMGVSFWAYAAFSLFFTLTVSRPVLESYRGAKSTISELPDEAPPTAASLNLASCHLCLKLVHVDQDFCTRCGSTMHLRKTRSIERTLALLFTACVVYIPANILPIMITDQLGQPIESTIIGGVVLLINTGSIAIAINFCV
mgnify:CR=1 FL=1